MTPKRENEFVMEDRATISRRGLLKSDVIAGAARSR